MPWGSPIAGAGVAEGSGAGGWQRNGGPAWTVDRTIFEVRMGL